MGERVWIVDSVEYGGTGLKVFDDEETATRFAQVMRTRGEQNLETNEYAIEHEYEAADLYWEVTYAAETGARAEGRGELPRFTLLDTVAVEDGGYSIWVQARGEHDAIAKAAERLADAGVAVEVVG